MIESGNGNGRNSIQKRKLKERLFGNQPFRRCCFCKTKLSFGMTTLEHVTPLSNGGGWSIDNLRLSCYCCNQERSSQDFEEFRIKKKEHRSSNST